MRIKITRNIQIINFFYILKQLIKNKYEKN